MASEFKEPQQMETERLNLPGRVARYFVESQLTLLMMLALLGSALWA